MIKLVCVSFLSLALAACTPPEPCASLCMSSLVEYEPGYAPVPLP